MTINIGLVATCLNTQHIRGMGKYVFELLQQSATESDLRWCAFANNPSIPLIVPETAQVERAVFNFRGDRFHLWEQIGLPWQALKHQVDLLHCTENSLPLWQPKPTVVTLHDTIMWDEPQSSDNTVYLNKILPAALAKCAAIITISESSRHDILARWPSFASKLTTIYHGIASEYFTENVSTPLPTDIQTALAQAPYLLYLGGSMARKRFSWALQVIAHSHHPSLKLVACGFSAEARQQAQADLPAELQGKVCFANFLSDAELRALYRGATAVLYPTLYEGFGFPALEAQASGVPVLFSALGSLRELIGPLAVVLPPNDLDAWLAAVTDVLAMGEHRQKKAEAAQQWAQQFSWSACFVKHLAVYRQVFAQAGGQRR
ncbi:hypothetical protein CKO12_04445 [Chromatium okenii]|uniref:glycosyltransferase family 4 protein n=1 Tax=Chromatium okenii TaxID=61644 RepID=UPI001903666C|nr:glycosyltransferase family 1 protein [Chromatium okenii]MBK1641133.1 hypothetical protein [Chromatium okenii]